MNRYLQDRAMRRSGMRDGRNPYGSRGGYVTSRRGRRDRADYDYDMNRGGRGRDSGDYDMAQNVSYPMYGIGGYRPYEGDMADYDYARRSGRGRDRNDYADYYDYDYAQEDEEWKQHLKKWSEKLKKKDRFNMPKDQVLQNAKQMGVKFEDYNEEEFLTTYYMVLSDYPKIANEPHTYLALAKDWLEDKDTALKGSEKLCAYYYEIVKGGEE